MTPLCDLARKHKTDKGGEHFDAGQVCHYYTPVYWNCLYRRRERVRKVLELGVNTGASLRMWEEFFPNANIIGIDNEPGTLFSTDRIQCEYADEANAENLAWVAAKHAPYDVIIDDGSHDPVLQESAAITLIATLKSLVGMYFIEDISDPELRTRLQGRLPAYTVTTLTCQKSLGPDPFRSELILIRPR